MKTAHVKLSTLRALGNWSAEDVIPVIGELEKRGLKETPENVKMIAAELRLDRLSKRERTAAENAAKREGWRLDDDGAFRHPHEKLDDGNEASFWYDGDWEKLVTEANIEVIDWW